LHSKGRALLDRDVAATVEVTPSFGRGVTQMLRWRTLGALELRSSPTEEQVAVLSQPKRVALLAYLAIAKPRGFHRRDTLLALFWPEMDTDHARAALRQALTFLRRELGEDVIRTRNGADLAVDPEHLWCDAAAFEDALEREEPAQAIALYQGDFLPGFHIGGCAEFERWLEQRRSELRDRAARAAAQLSVRAEGAGSIAEAVHWAHHQTTLQPDDERGLVRLLALLDRAGDRAAALKSYESFAARLATDYSAEPSPETQAIITRIRSRAASSAVDAPIPQELAPAQQLVEALAAQGSSVARGRSARRRWIGASAIAAVAFMIAVAWPSRSASRAASVSFILEPPTSVTAGGRVTIGDVAVSDDGKLLAYVLASDSASAVYVRKVDEVTSTRLRGTEGAFFVSFSPDAKWLAVVTTDRRLVKVAVDGSSSLTIVKNQGRLWGGVAWESNESLILPGDGLHRVSASGGPVRRVTTPRPPWRHYMALVAGDGETVAFMDAGLGFTEDDFLALGSLKTGVYHTTSLLVTRPIGIVDNHIVYATATGAIMAVPFNARERRITGDPIRLTEGLVFDVSNAKMSPTGTLVYRTGRRTNRLVVERDGQTTELLPEVGGHVQFLSAPHFSPDADRVAVSMQTSRGDTLTSDIWILDVASRSFTRLSSLGNVLAPTWTPDGRDVVFGTWFYRQPSLWRQAADGSRPPQRLFSGTDGANVWPVSVTHDGLVTFCGENVDGPAIALYSVPLSGGPKSDRIEILDPDCDAEVSPDGRWLAYAVTDGQQRNVYVRAHSRPTGRVRVSSNGGARPRWSRDGRRLYYAHTTAADGSGVLFGADLHFSANGVAIGRIDSIAALKPGTFFDVARDGSVLRLEPVPWTDQVVVKTNWLTELRAKLR